MNILVPALVPWGTLLLTHSFWKMTSKDFLLLNELLDNEIIVSLVPLNVRTHFLKTIVHDLVDHLYPHTVDTASFSQKTIFTYGIKEFTPYYRFYNFTRNRGQTCQSAIAKNTSRNFMTYVMYAGNLPGAGA